MGDRAEMAVFWIFTVPLIAASLGVVVTKNPITAAMSLVGAFFCLAGIYVLLTAHLVAFLQILVYAGAIMVLFLFVIMLLALQEEILGVSRIKVMQGFGALGCVGVFAVIYRAILATGPRMMPQVGEDYGTVKAVGRILFTQYLLPFEATSLLLLVAIVGAVVVAKQRI